MMKLQHAKNRIPATLTTTTAFACEHLLRLVVMLIHTQLKAGLTFRIPLCPPIERFRPIIVIGFGWKF